jgi:hypothetical protein
MKYITKNINIILLSLLFLYNFVVTKNIFFFKLSTSIFFLDIKKEIISYNNYKISMITLIDFLIYKNNLNLKKSNYRLWVNSLLSYINMYDEENELKYFYYCFFILICSNIYPNKFKNIIKIILLLVVLFTKPILLSYINILYNLYNFYKVIKNFLLRKNKKIIKLLLFVIDNLLYIEQFLIPNNNTFIYIYPLYYIIFLLYKYFQYKLVEN